ncbi:MAG: biotin--[acetyl-CoA-carboxylase] ligase [Candidatus Omnitrophota bacterium]
MDTGTPRTIETRSTRRSLGTKHVGTKVLVYDRVTSTNDLAHFLAKDGEPEGTVLFAHGQTQGRGRLGKTWESAYGKGLYCSFILRPDMEIQRLPRVTLITALAVVRALKELSVEDVFIKWPNDVLVAGKKIAGILTEMSLEADRLSYVVVGLGVNVNHEPGDLPKDAVSIRQILKREIDISDLAHSVVRHLDALYEKLTQGFSGLRDEVKACSGLVMGERVRVVSEHYVVEGYVVDFDDNGGLILRLDNGFLNTVHAGHLTKAGETE